MSFLDYIWFDVAGMRDLGTKMAQIDPLIRELRVSVKAQSGLRFDNESHFVCRGKKTPKNEAEIEWKAKRAKSVRRDAPKSESPKVKIKEEITASALEWGHRMSDLESSVHSPPYGGFGEPVPEMCMGEIDDDSFSMSFGSVFGQSSLGGVGTTASESVSLRFAPPPKKSDLQIPGMVSGNDYLPSESSHPPSNDDCGSLHMGRS